jgi:peptidoglycan/xylan/chitin deacetylase (PgdA/CDA1 family)
MTVLVSAPEGYAGERRYVLDVIFAEWLGLDYDVVRTDGPGVAIRMAGDPENLEVTLPDVLFSTSRDAWLTARSMPALPLAHLPGDALGPLRPNPNAPRGDSLAAPLPILFGDPDASGRPWRVTENGVSIPIDIFGSVFFLLTRYEEVVRPERDKHQRFPARASLAVEEGFEDRAIVDEYVDLLWNAMQRLWPSLVRKSSTFRLRLTHDIDQPWAALGQRTWTVAHALAGDLLRRRDPILAAQRVRALSDARTGRVDRDPLNTFDLLMDTSERFGLRSVFYFMAGNTPADFDFRYRLSDPPFAGVLRRIHERGHEIGLHASYVSYLSAERTRMEFAALKAVCREVGFEQPAWGVRQHYLRFANPQTWRNQESAGLEHDSTLGFAERIGFRAGTCREYPLFDVLSHRTMKLRERPLVVMDWTLFEYMGLDLDDAAARARAVVEVCRWHGGDAVLLYHNAMLAGARQRAHYRELVEELVRPG